MHRDDVEHHPLGLVAALAEGLDDLQALGDLLALRVRVVSRISSRSVSAQAVDVEVLEQLADRLGAHAASNAS
jgi:hypothetical protein